VPSRKLDAKLIALCAIIFLADIVLGILVSTFSVYARISGTTVATIGLINTVAGLIQLGAAIPFGTLSDRVGRFRLLAGGLMAFAAAMLVLALSASAQALWFGKLFFGLGSVAVFQTGHALVGDLTRPDQRHFAFGLLSTCMALGYGLGPFLGGILTDHLGHAFAYLLAVLVALAAGYLAARTFPAATDPASQRARRPSTLFEGVRLICGMPDLLLVTFANMMMGLTFSATLGTFLPLYCRELTLSQTTIGTMFAIRSGVSALGRMPNSLLAQKIGSLPVMLVALSLDAVAMFGICSTRNPGAIIVLLAMDGLAYGGFVVAGQTYVSNRTTMGNRGATGGAYAMASGIAGTAGPFILGMVAERWGLRFVFGTTGAVLGLGAMVFAIGIATLRGRRLSASKTQAEIALMNQPELQNRDKKPSEFKNRVVGAASEPTHLGGV
jgi:MFS family permease